MVGTLKQHRMFKGLTQTDMAEKLRITRQTYNAWESHPENLSFKTGVMIANTLGVDFLDIIFVPEMSTECKEERR